MFVPPEPRRYAPESGAEGGSGRACRRLARAGVLVLILAVASAAAADEAGAAAGADEAGVEAPVETSVEAGGEAPVESAGEAGGEAPVESAGEASVEASGAPAAEALAVLDLGAPPVLRNLARALAVAIADEARDLGHRTVDSREVAAAVGADRAEALADCGVDTRCLSAALRDAPVGRVVSGTLDRGRTAYEVRLVYVDLATGQVIGRLNRDILIASRRLERDVREAVPGVLAGAAEEDGVLVVATGVPGTRVVLNQALVGETPPDVRVSLQPGRHHLRVIAPDHLPYDRYVEIVAGEELLLEPRLFLEPGRAPPTLVADTPADEHPAVSGLQSPPATLISLGVGVLAVGGGAWLGMQARDIERAAIDRTGDGFLDITRTDALAGKRHARNANLLYGLAGASLIAATVFAVLPIGAGGGAAEGAPEVGVHLGPGAAALTLGGPLP